MKNDSEHTPGDGVYTRFGYIHSCQAGVVQLTDCENGTQVLSDPFLFSCPR